MRHVTCQRCVFLVVGFIAAGSAALHAGASRPRVLDQSKPATATVSGSDACALLTKEDAATAVGGTVGDGKATTVNDAGHVAKSCAYDGSGMRSIQLNLFLFAPGSAEVQVYRGLCGKKEQVTGLGDMACWYNDRHRELQVLKGGTVMAIEITRSGDASDALKAVAKKIVDRMPAK